MTDSTMTAGRRVALVTGANKGIGLEVVRRLTEAGYFVWLGARDPERGRRAVGTFLSNSADVRFLEIDVTDSSSVLRAAERVRAETQALNVLVNNSGIANDGRAIPSTADVDSMKALYEVNVFGVVRTTQAFLPLLREAPSARIVMVSSGLGSLHAQADPQDQYAMVNVLGYQSSKSALNSLTISFSRELRDTPIKVNAADPGYTATDLNGHSGPRSVQQAAEIVVRLATLPDDGPTGGFFNEDGPLSW